MANELICSVCGESKSALKRGLPKGWKRTDAFYCGKCWKEWHVLRAITIPVTKPLGISWDDLRPMLREAFSMSTACANWMVSQLYTKEKPRTPKMKKLGKRPDLYLYPGARKCFPSLPSRTVSSMEQSLKKTYNKLRLALVWKGEVSLPSFRYPYPFTANNQAWEASYEHAGKDEDGAERGDKVPCVSVAILGADRCLLQLKGGRDWQGQLADFRKFISGEAIKGDLQIIEKRSGSRGNGTTVRDEGGQKKNCRIMVKMVGWFPRQKQKPVGGSLLIRKDATAILVVSKQTENGMATVRTWHWPHLQRWKAEHSQRLQQWGDDQKAEQRRPHASFASRREAACAKYRNRMESAQKELAHQVAELARRQRVAEVVYDDKDHGYFGGDKWTWSAFETVLANKLNEFGVQFKRKETDD